MPPLADFDGSESHHLLFDMQFSPIGTGNQDLASRPFSGRERTESLPQASNGPHIWPQDMEPFDDRWSIGSKMVGEGVSVSGEFDAMGFLITRTQTPLDHDNRLASAPETPSIEQSLFTIDLSREMSDHL